MVYLYGLSTISMVYLYGHSTIDSIVVHIDLTIDLCVQRSMVSTINVPANTVSVSSSRQTGREDDEMTGSVNREPQPRPCPNTTGAGRVGGRCAYLPRGPTGRRRSCPEPLGGG